MKLEQRAELLTLNNQYLLSRNDIYLGIVNDTFRPDQNNMRLLPDRIKRNLAVHINVFPAKLRTWN